MVFKFPIKSRNNVSEIFCLCFFLSAEKKNKTMQGNHKDIFDMQNQYNILSKLEHSLTVKLTIMLII